MRFNSDDMQLKRSWRLWNIFKLAQFGAKTGTLTTLSLINPVIHFSSSKNVYRVNTGQSNFCPNGPLLLLVAFPFLTTGCNNNSSQLNGAVRTLPSYCTAFRKQLNWTTVCVCHIATVFFQLLVTQKTQLTLQQNLKCTGLRMRAKWN